MRNMHLAPMVVAASLAAPLAFAAWTATAGSIDRADLGDDHSVRALPAFQPVADTASGRPRDPSPSATDPAATLTDDEASLIEWARARFALVDLELPHVDVVFHDDTEPCNGNDGRFRSEGERREIVICVPDHETSASQLHRRRTLVHELAHAWDHANLDDDDRSELLAIVGATDWYAPDSEWHERGVERFAETIVWGLYDQLRRPVLIDVTCDELRANFRAITGSEPLGPLETVCR